ncbi:MAG: YciI family protein [Caldilineaceae bacterium]
MRYLLLIYGDEAAKQAMRASTPGAIEAEMASFRGYMGELARARALVHNEALQPVASAQTVAVRDGQILVTHAPFAETREQLGGIFIIRADSMDQAIGWAARLPGATVGRVEVRPVLDFSA